MYIYIYSIQDELMVPCSVDNISPFDVFGISAYDLVPCSVDNISPFDVFGISAYDLAGILLGYMHACTCI